MNLGAILKDAASKLFGDLTISGSGQAGAFSVKLGQGHAPQVAGQLYVAGQTSGGPLVPLTSPQKQALYVLAAIVLAFVGWRLVRH